MEEDPYAGPSQYELSLAQAEDRADKIRRSEAFSQKEKKSLLAANAIRFDKEIDK